MLDQNIDPKTLNEIFLQKIDTDIEKVASESGSFVRTRLREAAFSRKIINPVYVTKADLQRSLYHDQLVKIVDIEPESVAMPLTLRGAPTIRYIEGPRFEIPFFNISSEEFQKTEEELLAYEMPITEVIERNSIKDIQYVEDSRFMHYVEAAIAKSGKVVPHTVQPGQIDLHGFIKLFNRLEEAGADVSGQRFNLKTDVVLMNQADWNKLLLLPATEIGSGASSEQYINGFKYETLLGKKFVVTNKGDLVPEGSIYAFASQEFIGKFYILNDTKFFIEKKRNLIKFSAYQTIGMGIGNHRSMAKLVLSEGS